MNLATVARVRAQDPQWCRGMEEVSDCRNCFRNGCPSRCTEAKVMLQGASSLANDTFSRGRRKGFGGGNA